MNFQVYFCLFCTLFFMYIFDIIDSGGEDMKMKYKIDVLSALKNSGYSTYRLRIEKILNESTIQKLRNGSTDISVKTLDVLCGLLKCQPNDVLEYVPDSNQSE